MRLQHWRQSVGCVSCIIAVPTSGRTPVLRHSIVLVGVLFPFSFLLPLISAAVVRFFDPWRIGQ